MAQWIKPNINIDFIGRRKKFWTLSVIVVLLSIAAMAGNFFVRGEALNWGTDFKGGTQIQVQFAKPMAAGVVRQALNKAGYRGAEVVQMEDSATPNLFMLRLTETSSFSKKEEDSAQSALKKAFGDNLTTFEFEQGGDRLELRFKEGFQVAPGDAPVAPATQPVAPATQPVVPATQPVVPATQPVVPAKAAPAKAAPAKAAPAKAAPAKAAPAKAAPAKAAPAKAAPASQPADPKARDPKANEDAKKANEKKAATGAKKAAPKPAKKAEVIERADFRRLRDVLSKAGIHVQNVVQPGRAQDNRYEVILGGLGEDVRKVFGKGSVLDIPQVESVGAKMGSQLRNDGIKSVLYALLLMLVYIAIRFDFRYAPGAVVALAHDVVITTGLFAVTWVEFNLPVVAALLTIAGYSINDTIVVFDRIRENVARLRDRKFPLVVNASINETLSRTVLTSLTTLFTCVSIWVIGTGVLKTFAFALTAGVLVGTYSSIFIASPIVVVLNDRLTRRAKAR